MNDSHQNYNHTRIYHQAKHFEDQEFVNLEDNYFFKTHPSFHISEQNSNKLPKSQNYFKDSRRDDYKKYNKIKRKATMLANHEEPINLIKQQNCVQTKKQIHLKHQISALTKQNNSFKKENINLRSYVQFLQDYNLKLKKQLMRVLRRRNLDSSLGSIYDPRNSGFNERQDIPPQNNQKQAFQNQYFSTIQPMEKLISKPIFTNYRLKNQGPYRNISFGQSQQNKINSIKYVVPFYESTEKPHHQSFYSQKNQHDDLKQKVYSTSLQSSFMNVSSEFNPQTYSNQKQIDSKKTCNCLNQSLPVIQKISTPLSNDQQYYRSLDHSSTKIKEKSTEKNVVCAACLKQKKFTKKNLKPSKITKKNLKHKNKDAHNYQRTTKQTTQRCVSCKEKNSSKRSNASKSTIPTKQKHSFNFFHSNQLSKKLNSSLNEKAKPRIIRQMIEISQFRP